MRRWGIGFAAGILICAAAVGQTADELVAKNIQARGGLEKIRSVQSMRLTGNMTAGGETMPSVLELKRPNKSRWEFSVGGQTAVQAYDGKAGWMVMPFEGRVEPERMSAEDLDDVALQADMDGPLVDYESKGNRIAVVGKESVVERDAWKLEVTLKNGEIRFVYLDAKTYLQFLTVSTKTIDGKKVELESAIGDYRDVGGLRLPHSFEASAKGMPERQSLKFEKIELNVPIDDARFRMPAAKKSAPAPGPEPTPVVS